MSPSPSTLLEMPNVLQYCTSAGFPSQEGFDLQNASTWGFPSFSSSGAYPQFFALLNVSSCIPNVLEKPACAGFPSFPTIFSIIYVVGCIKNTTFIYVLTHYLTIMKTIRISLEDKDFKRLERLKKKEGSTWEEFMFKRIEPK